MQLPPGEPAAGPWEVRPLAAVRAALSGRVIAVDGRSGAGKTTFAARLGLPVVHTDDIAWHESFFGWSELMRAARDRGVLGRVGGRGDPLLAADRPWERADLFVAGTPVLEHGPDEVVVATPR